MQRANGFVRTTALAALFCGFGALVTGCAGNDADEDHGSADAADTSVSAVSTTVPLGTWRLVPKVGERDVTFDVKDDGGFSGAGPCNNYFGKWTLGAEQSTIGPIGATRMMCAEEAMEREQAYFDALGRVAGWRSTAAGIVLVDAEGGVLLGFVAAE